MTNLTCVARIRTRPVSLSLPSPSPAACACNGGSGTRSSPAAEKELILSFVACFWLLFLETLVWLRNFDRLVWFGEGLAPAPLTRGPTAERRRWKTQSFWIRANLLELSMKSISLQEISFKLFVNKPERCWFSKKKSFCGPFQTIFPQQITFLPGKLFPPIFSSLDVFLPGS